MTGNTLQKKIRNAQLASFNYQCIVGNEEETNFTVNVRSRESKDALGVFPLAAFIAKLKDENEPSSQKFNTFVEYKGRMPEGAAAAPAASTIARAASAPAGKAEKAEKGA